MSDIRRREFLKFFGLGAVGATFSNVLKMRKKGREFLYPYVTPPPGVIPGVANWYNSVCRTCSAGCGIQVKIREGQAKKIEGNPDHPINAGRVCARGQAALQAIYNPDRITGPRVRSGAGFENITWDEAITRIGQSLTEIAGSGRASQTVFLTEPLRGTLGALIATFMERYGSQEFYSYELLTDDALLTANELSFGMRAYPDYDIKHADYVLSFSSDILDTWLSPVKHGVDYGLMRDVNGGIPGSRGWLVHFEPRLTLTGAAADEWHPIYPESEGLLALSIANVIAANGWNDPSISAEMPAWRQVLEPYAPEKVIEHTGMETPTVVKVAQDFSNAASAMAISGGQGTAQKNGVFNAVAANVLNFLGGAVKRATISPALKFPVPAPLTLAEKPLSQRGLQDLVERMNSGEVAALFMNNANPAFTMPEGEEFVKALNNVSLVVSFSSFLDETTSNANFVLPASNSLESWGDYVPLVDNGQQTLGLVQPVVSEVFDTHPLGDTILSLARTLGGPVASALPEEDFQAYLKKSWQALHTSGLANGTVSESDFDRFWESSVMTGGWWQDIKKYFPVTRVPEPSILRNVTHQGGAEQQEGESQFHLHLYPSSGPYDGRGANLPWLQQLPEPLITASWGTWGEISQETADELDIKEGDLMEISSSRGKITVPAYVTPAIMPDVVGVPIGQGHTAYGRYAKDIGTNAIRLLDAKQEFSGGIPLTSTQVSLRKTGEREDVVKLEPNLNVPGLEKGLRELDRHIVQWIDPEENAALSGQKSAPITAVSNRDLREAPHFPPGLEKYRESDVMKESIYRWGMVIDLDKCTGCQACMVACYAENNAPLSDRSQLAIGRHKNWIRVDRYWEGELPNVRAKMIPVNCYQCGNAPCEAVCPVYAAFRTIDGLNAQVYQRCVGTRFCNATCPYRSRLFNWFGPEWPEPLHRQLNSDISARPSGVTDKCTFCVQRIRVAKDRAKDEKRTVSDGEVMTACQQTCPTGAISFGNLKDTSTKVSQLTTDPRRYRVLEALATEPAVIYLKAIRRGAEEHGETEHGAEEAGSEEHGAEEAAPEEHSAEEVGTEHTEEEAEGHE